MYFPNLRIQNRFTLWLYHFLCDHKASHFSLSQISSFEAENKCYLVEMFGELMHVKQAGESLPHGKYSINVGYCYHHYYYKTKKFYNTE